MENNKLIHVVTSNNNKFKEMASILGNNAVQISLDLPEIQGNPEEIIIKKAETAFDNIGKELIVEDTSLCFNALGGLPGVYIKWFLLAIGPHGIVKMLDGFSDKSGYAQTLIGYKSPYRDTQIFTGRTYGSIVSPRGANSFGWDPCFLPDGEKDTYAELSLEDKNKISQRAKATKLFKDYLTSIKKI